MTSSLEKQEGGSHYKDMAIQPVEFIHANKLGYFEGNVVKYVCRHQAKNGVEDLKKAMHYLQLLMELKYEKLPRHTVKVDPSTGKIYGYSDGMEEFRIVCGHQFYTTD